MYKTLVFLIIVLFIFQQTFAKKNDKLQMLILSGRNNHEWKTTTPFLEKMYVQSGLFEVQITDKPDTLKSADIQNFDALVSNWSSFPDKEYRWPAETEKALIEFIRNGGGFVTVHAATTAFYEWPEFKQFSTGAWIDGTLHRKQCEAEVKIQNITHPVTKGMANFSIFEELWVNAEQNSDFEVLATATNENTTENQAVAMVRKYGKGRIFHTTLGHDVRMMRNTGFQTLMLRGTEWAATGKVKQKFPQELQESVDKNLKWQETDTTFALMHGKNVVWQYNFRDKYQKPYFNPVFVGRNNITSVAPDDHPWHAGQWFSWKYINDVNSWEFVNRTEFRSEGTTDIEDVKFTRNKDFSAEIALEIICHPANAEDVLAETRTIKVSAPRADGTVSMDYRFTFEALVESVELNRTPLEGEENGKVWGGYGGLSLRFNQSFMDSYFISSWDSNKGFHRQNGNWLFMGFTGLDRNKVGSQIIVNPNSKREEAAWYVTDTNDLPFYYISPAYLFEKSQLLLKGEKLVLNYRINHIAGEITKNELQKKFQEYKKN